MFDSGRHWGQTWCLDFKCVNVIVNVWSGKWICLNEWVRLYSVVPYILASPLSFLYLDKLICIDQLQDWIRLHVKILDSTMNITLLYIDIYCITLLYSIFPVPVCVLVKMWLLSWGFFFLSLFFEFEASYMLIQFFMIKLFFY